MQKPLVFIIVIFMTIAMFVPMALNTYTQDSTMQMKRALNLSSKVLVSSTDLTELFDQEMDIDKDRLLDDFYSLLRTNLGSEKLYNRVRGFGGDAPGLMPIKVLVLQDRFYIADYEDKWSIPYFFTYSRGDRVYYLMSNDSKAYTYGANDEKDWVDLDYLGLTESKKNSIIIDKVNEQIYENTVNYEVGYYTALNVKISNPADVSIESIEKKAGDIASKGSKGYYSTIKKLIEERNLEDNFSIIGGPTFFVIYHDFDFFKNMKEETRLRNYNVAGYSASPEQDLDIDISDDTDPLDGIFTTDDLELTINHLSDLEDVAVDSLTMGYEGGTLKLSAVTDPLLMDIPLQVDISSNDIKLETEDAAINELIEFTVAENTSNAPKTYTISISFEINGLSFTETVSIIVGK